MVAYADSFGVSVHTFASAAKRLLGTRPAFTVDRLSWVPDESGLLMSGTDEELHRQQVRFAPVSSPYAHLLLENATRAASSPDGAKIAFLRDENRELWQATAEGLNPRLLRRAAAGETFDLVLWSPAGDRLLTTPRTAASTATGGSAAEIGNRGAYEFLDAESGNLLQREEGFAAASGYLLLDGSFFFAQNATPSPTYFGASFMVVSLDLHSGRMLAAPRRVRELEAGRADYLSASLTGNRAAAVLQRAAVDVFVADIRSPGPELSHVARLSRGGTQTFPHSWTADAKGILIEKDPMERTGAAARSSIYYLPVDGAKPTLLASLPENSAMAQLSPDGRWILFLEFTSYSQRALGLFRIAASGEGQIEQVKTPGEITEFHCSVSVAGRCVVRATVGKEELVFYALDPLLGIGSQLGRIPWQPNQLGDWGLSPDGRTVAIANHDTLHPSIGLLRLESKPARVQDITVQGHGSMLGAGWASDGKSLFVECRTESGFELVSLDLAGRAKLLRKSPAMIWAVPSRDGDRIAFPDVTSSSSVWALDGNL